MEVAVVALGSVRNTEWLRGAGLAADGRGVVCDASCRAFDADGVVTDDIFVAGDVARWPHPALRRAAPGGRTLEQCRRPRLRLRLITCWAQFGKPAARTSTLPSFWSNQFGVNIKAVGLPTIADTIVLTQGSMGERRLIAAYGHQGRLVAAVGC